MIRVGTRVGIIGTQTKVNSSTTLASNSGFGIIRAVTKDNIFAAATVGGIVNVLRMINWIAGGNVLAIIDALGSNIINFLPSLQNIFDAFDRTLGEKPAFGFAPFTRVGVCDVAFGIRHGGIGGLASGGI